MNQLIIKPLNNLTYNIEYIGTRKEIFVFKEIYGNFLIILDNNNININDYLKFIEIAIILEKQNDMVNIKYKLNSNIFKYLKEKCNVEYHKLDKLKKSGFLNDGRIYYLYNKAYGKIVIISKNISSGDEIEEKQNLINQLIKEINISIVISENKIKTKTITSQVLCVLL